MTLLGITPNLPATANDLADAVAFAQGSKANDPLSL